MLLITGPNGDMVEVLDRPGGARLLKITGHPAGGELLLDAQSAIEVGEALGAHPANGEETLEKVRAALRKASPFAPDYAIVNAINEMQNVGILFRERF